MAMDMERHSSLQNAKVKLSYAILRLCMQLILVSFSANDCWRSIYDFKIDVKFCAIF